MTGQPYTDAQFAADTRTVRSGTTPADAEWDHARAAWEAADQALAATPQAGVPQPVHEAVDALGGLLAVWDGYGEDE